MFPKHRKGVLQLHKRKGGIGTSHEGCLRLSVTSTTATKSNKTAESASLGRQQSVPTKCESPVSPFPFPR